MTEQEKRITVRVAESLHRKVKARAALEGKSVSDVLRDYLVEWVKTDPPTDEGEGPEKK
jgi:predicted HicB family RNase H-like nuclease